MGIGTFDGRKERCFVRSYQSCRLYIYRVILQVWCSVVCICLVHVANVILYIGVYSREFIHIKRFRVSYMRRIPDGIHGDLLGIVNIRYAG